MKTCFLLVFLPSYLPLILVYSCTTEFIQGDEISGSCTISFSLEDERDPIQDPVVGPGRYVVTWCRWAILIFCLKAIF